MSDHIADAGKMVPDTIEQAARVIAGEIEHNESAGPSAIAQALHEAGMLVSGEPVAWRYRSNRGYPEWIDCSSIEAENLRKWPDDYEVQGLVPLPTPPEGK